MTIIILARSMLPSHAYSLHFFYQKSAALKNEILFWVSLKNKKKVEESLKEKSQKGHREKLFHQDNWNSFSHIHTKEPAFNLLFLLSSSALNKQILHTREICNIRLIAHFGGKKKAEINISWRWSQTIDVWDPFFWHCKKKKMHGTRK